MKKYNTSPISGMQELLPSAQATFDQFKSQIAEVFHRHGFQNIETPTIDRTDILLAKAGGDTEKQIYKVVKTAETATEADQALRFDHTVPLARYVVEHENDLPFPFKVTQIGRNFRGERAQKGRFREFYQCDVDVIGRNQLPLEYDADVIVTLYTALQAFKLPSMCIRISNRKILNGLLDSLQLTTQSAQIFNIIDHAEKVPASTTQASLVELQLNPQQIQTITHFIDLNGPRTSIITQLKQDFPAAMEHPIFQEGINELDQVLQAIECQIPQPELAIADLKIVRGLDYYTGTVFETFLSDYIQLGSICSGGRYDNLATHYTEHRLPGVGGSIGLTRLFYVLQASHLLQDYITQPLDYVIIPLSADCTPVAYQLAANLRQRGYSTDILFSHKKYSDNMNYASKVAKQAITIGAKELAEGQYSVKDFASGAVQSHQLPAELRLAE